MNNNILELNSKVNELTIEDSYIHGDDFSLEYILDILTKLENIFNLLRKEVHSTSIGSEADEIIFFKELKPSLLSKLLYYKEIYSLEVRNTAINKEMQKKYYQNKVERIKTYFDDNLSIYEYYRSKANYMDKLYFLRGQFNFKHCLNCINFDRDPKFSTCYDHKFAMIMCYDMLSIHIEKKLHNLERLELVEKHRKDLPKHPFRWTDSKTAAVELGYAIYARGSLNNGNADIKEIMTYLEAAFDIDLEDYYRTFYSLKNRKKSQITYLDSLKEALQKKIDDDS
jgi:RteC protein.